MAKGIKTGGRKKGTPNKSQQDVQVLLDAVFKQVDPIEKLVNLLHKPLDAGVEARVLLRLLEYRYGQPRQEISGLNGGALQIQIVSAIERPARRGDFPS